MFQKKIKSDEFKDYIKHIEWTEAKGFKETPHEYVVGAPREIFDFIYDNGYKKEFKGRKYTYFNLDGYRYWRVGMILNRAKNKAKKEVPELD